MNKKKFFPEIRFKGFDDVWRQFKLRDMAEKFEYGLNSSAIEYDGENKYIRITDIDEATNKFLMNKVTSPDANLLVSDNYILKEGDILFARTGASVGKTYQYNKNDGKVYFAGFLIRARIRNDFDSQFVFQNTHTLKYSNFIRVTSQRSGQPGVNAQEYASFQIIVPKKEEQIKIGKLFQSIDEIIVLQQQLLNDHKQLKEAMLQKMFPQKGEAVPKVRFADFSDEWKEYKSKDIFCSISDKNHSNLPVLSASQQKGMIYRSDINIDIQYNKESTKTYKRVIPGQFVIHLRSFQGGFAYSNIEGITSPAYTVIDFKCKDSQKAMFWKHILTSNSFIKTLETITYGIRDGRSISFSEFSTLKFRVPSYNEQDKISTFFDRLDSLIASNQKKLETYQELKKAMLQKMFV